MGKVIRNAILGLLVVVLILLAGVMMNRSTKLLEHWSYPTEYSELIEPLAEEYDVPLSVVYAVIRAESKFDPAAESRVGARGLMQITEVAWEWIDYYRGESFGSWDEMYDPKVNLSYGIWFLSYLYNEFGNWETSYAAYNAGFNAVKKWLGDPQYSHDGVTLYKIPYEETANYREKVSAYRESYQSVYGFD